MKSTNIAGTNIQRQYNKKEIDNIKKDVCVCAYDVLLYTQESYIQQEKIEMDELEGWFVLLFFCYIFLILIPKSYASVCLILYLFFCWVHYKKLYMNGGIFFCIVDKWLY